jgi:hypothetical protein
MVPMLFADPAGSPRRTAAGRCDREYLADEALPTEHAVLVRWLGLVPTTASESCEPAGPPRSASSPSTNARARRLGSTRLNRPAIRPINSSSIPSQSDEAGFWRKSSKSGYNGSCVEVAKLGHGQVGIRDTKAHGAGPVLVFTHAEWHIFLSKVKRGNLDFSG